MHNIEGIHIYCGTVQARFPQFQIPNGEKADAPEKIDNSKVSYAHIACHNMNLCQMQQHHLVPNATTPSCCVQAYQGYIPAMPFQVVVMS